MNSESNYAIIPAVSRGISRTLVDGTIRVSMDIEPAYAMQAMMLLGMPGQAVAIAALETGTAIPEAPERPEMPGNGSNRAATAKTEEPTSTHPKGGALARSAAILCGTETFRAFLSDVHSVPDDPILAASFVRSLCGIESRAELDSNGEAQRQFRSLMAEYRRWQEPGRKSDEGL